MKLDLATATMGRVKTMSDVKAQTRADRLKAALRENLKRRKTQARSRETEADPAKDRPADAPPVKGSAD